MCRLDGQDITVLVKFYLVDTELTIEAVNGVRIVVTMIDDIVIIPVYKNGMMTRSVNGSVSVCYQNRTLVGIRADRTDRTRRITYLIGVVVTAAG